MKVLNDKKLIAASEHVMYEWWMLYSLHDLILARSRGPITHATESEVHTIDPSWIRDGSPFETLVVMHNALIEAFALHARVLYDFFYGPSESRKPDDIGAEHFFSESEEWQTARPALNKDKIDAIRNRINKEIAHLTYMRQMIPYDSKDWPITELMQELNLVVERFLHLVPPHLLDRRWTKLRTS